MALERLHSDLWVATAPLRFLGLEVGARMAIVRRPGGGLVLHSPIAASPDLLREIEMLGPVETLLAPNQFHHLFVGAWQQAFPRALAYVAPGLDTKRPDLEVAGLLGDDPEPAWADTLEQVRLDGIPMTNEVVFFHRPSRSLIASDLAFNIGHESPFLTRLAFRMARAFGRVSPTFLERLLVRDRVAFRDSLKRILEWPFERVVVAHGQVSEHGGREELTRGYGWVLNDEGRG